jgi:glutaredoxin-related protein
MIQVISFDIGIRNFAYCILHVFPDVSQPPCVHRLEVVDLGCSKGNKQAAIDAILDLLDEIVFHQLDLTKPIVVLIEQQMTATMKAIQVAINVFFKMTAKYQSVDLTTKYLSAKHKLALRSRYPEYNDAAADGGENVATTKYKQNKKDGIHFGLWCLQEVLKDSENYQKVVAMKKKDDACDTLLMCMYYYTTNCDK